jgi:predicted transglutaminase-like cysteine proteinase
MIDAVPPYGWIEYCSTQPNQPCHLGRPPSAQEAAVINLVINEGITGKEDSGADTWRAFPPDRTGDCDDYAVTKRAALIAFGADPDGLQIITGEAQYPDGRRFFHVVLQYQSPNGTFILDNLSPELYAAHARPYPWTEEARQSASQLYWQRSPP